MPVRNRGYFAKVGAAPAEHSKAMLLIFHSQIGPFDQVDVVRAVVTDDPELFAYFGRAEPGSRD
jgi:hypothetical protein